MPPASSQMVCAAKRPDQPLLSFVRPSDVQPFRSDRRRRRLAQQAERCRKAEDHAEVIRGVLIQTMDRSYCSGRVGELLWRDNENDQLRTLGVDVFQAIMEALFPEEFAENAGDAIAEAMRRKAANPARPWYAAEADSLLPVGGPKRVGAARLEAAVTALARKVAARAV
jgi:hypothetical protein